MLSHSTCPARNTLVFSPPAWPRPWRTTEDTLSYRCNRAPLIQLSVCVSSPLVSCYARHDIPLLFPSSPWSLRFPIGNADPRRPQTPFKTHTPWCYLPRYRSDRPLIEKGTRPALGRTQGVCADIFYILFILHRNGTRRLGHGSTR